MFSRIAVVNRGEPAMRLTRAVRELNAEHGYGIRVIALHTESERRASFVRAADEAVVLRETGAGNPYLDHEELGRALRESRADAAWVGWGFVAEDPAFAELCASLGVTFIGPPPEALRLLGAKIEAKVLAEQTGVPVAPWSGGPVEGVEDGRRHAAAIGYPLIVKSRSGGGGRGIRIVRAEAELEEALTRTRVEAERTFGDPTIFMERLVEGGRHVEVQVIADQHGGVWAPGVRDCSVQRRNQKVIEESSSPALTAEQSTALRESSMALVKAAGYVGAGERLLQLGLGAHDPDAAAPTPAPGLDDQRVADRLRVPPAVVDPGHRPAAPRRHRNPGLLGEHLGLDLGTEQPHGLRRRADERDAQIGAQLGERRVLGDEAPADPGGVGAGGEQRRLEQVVVEVGPGARGAEGVGEVGLAHEHGGRLGVRVERDRADRLGSGVLGVQVADRVDQPHRRLAAVDDRDPAGCCRVA